MHTFEQYLTEIGDSNRPYKFNFMSIRQLDPKHQPGIVAGVATFHADISKFKITLNTETPDTSWAATSIETDVVFSKMGGPDDLDVTNAGLNQAFRIMATVIAATKFYVLEVNKRFGIKIENITFESSDQIKGQRGSDKKSGQRTKLYMAFIKKQFTGVKIRPGRDFNSWEISVPKRFYK